MDLLQVLSELVQTGDVRSPSAFGVVLGVMIPSLGN